MQLNHQFTVPEQPDDVFELLLDVERVAPCLPGARLTGRDGDEFRGSIKVKVGPLSAAYEGTASIKDVDEDARTATLVASGAEVGGQGGADARVQLEVQEVDGASRVGIVTDLDIRGRAAQFGRGVMDDVAGRILQQFARNLEATLSAPADGQAPAPADERRAATTAESGRPTDAGAAAVDSEPLDLLQASWQPLVQRALPYAVALIVGMLLGRLFSRRGAASTPTFVVPAGWAAPPHGRSD